MQSNKLLRVEAQKTQKKRLKLLFPIFRRDYLHVWIQQQKDQLPSISCKPVFCCVPVSMDRFHFFLFQSSILFQSMLISSSTLALSIPSCPKEGRKRKDLMIMLLFSKISTFQNTLRWRTLSAKKRALAREFQAVFAAYDFRSLLECTQVKYGKMSGLVAIFPSEVSLELFSPCLHQHISRRLPVSELL